MGVLQLTEENFETEVLQDEGTVLVDFWAEWCGPCKVIGPIIDEIAQELEGKLKVAKVDVSSQQNLATKYNVMSIPTIILFKKGQVADQMVGALPKDQLLEKIKTILA